MNSGRRKRIMIACVTFETAKITEPVAFYEANKVHLIHYTKDPSENNVYNDFYSRVTELIREISCSIEIVEHNETVYDFGLMLKTVLNIIQTEKSGDDDCEIYVNVSAGTSEYTAASTIASMMVPGTVPFSVNTKEFTVDKEHIRDVYYIDGNPVGLTKTSGEPKILPNYSIEMPDEYLVRGLRILDSRIKSKSSVSSTYMVNALKENGLWYRDTESSGDRKTSQRQVEAVYYQRDFISQWIKYGWIRKDERTGKYRLTDSGNTVIDTFYTYRFYNSDNKYK